MRGRAFVTALAIVVTVGAQPSRAFAAGELDPSFGAGGEEATPLTDLVGELAVDSQGRIVVAGFVDFMAGVSAERAVVRYRSDGRLDPTFGENGIARLGESSASGSCAIGVGPDDRPLVAWSSEVSGTPFQAITVMRLQPEGTIDPAFGDAGAAIFQFSADNNPAPQLLVHPDGRFDVATLFCDGSDCGLLASYFTADGGTDGGFSTHDGLDLVNQARVALQADGRIVLAGRRDEQDTAFSLVLARYDRRGAIDRAFGKGGTLVTEVALSRFYGASIALAPDGTIVTAGSDGSVSTVARFSSSGKPDRAFGTDGTTRLAVQGASETVANAVAVGADGRIVVAGGAGALFVGDDWFVAAVEANGALATDFGDGGLVVRTPGRLDDDAFRVRIQPDGRIVVAGLVGRDVVVARYLGFPRACGDADGNGAITVTDGVQALRAAAALASACLPEFCDVDASGAVSVTDGVRVLRAAADLPSDLACPP